MLFLVCTCLLTAYIQAQIGLKAGLNFANVTNASSVNAGNTTGFHAGLFLAPHAKNIFGYRTEFIFSRQGYDFKTSSATGNVKLDYILLPQLMTINISKYFQLQAGFQMAFLLNAKADSSTSGNGSNPYQKIMDYYNRFDYGFAGGVEINPVKGLIVGARYNISFSSMYKTSDDSNVPGFIPDMNNLSLKNNVFQIFLGYKF